MSYPQRLAQDFSAAAEHYDSFAQLQHEIIDSLQPWLPPQQAGQKVLDAGAGTGYALRPGWLALDIAEGMCRKVANHPAICADMQSLPVADAAIDGVFSSLAMQWLAQPQAFLREAYRCTHEQGWLVAATLGPKTLLELRQAFQAAGMEPPLLPFRSVEQLKQDCEIAGWRLERCEVEMMTTTHSNIKALLQNLKGLGARYKTMTGSKGMRGRGWLEGLQQHYPNNLNNNINISWEVIKIKLNKAYE